MTVFGRSIENGLPRLFDRKLYFPPFPPPPRPYKSFLDIVRKRMRETFSCRGFCDIFIDWTFSTFSAVDQECILPYRRIHWFDVVVLEVNRGNSPAVIKHNKPFNLLFPRRTHSRKRPKIQLTCGHRGETFPPSWGASTGPCSTFGRRRVIPRLVYTLHIAHTTHHTPTQQVLVFSVFFSLYVPGNSSPGGEYDEAKDGNELDSPT